MSKITCPECAVGLLSKPNAEELSNAPFTPKQNESLLVCKECGHYHVVTKKSCLETINIKGFGKYTKV